MLAAHSCLQGGWRLPNSSALKRVAPPPRSTPTLRLHRKSPIFRICRHQLFVEMVRREAAEQQQQQDEQQAAAAAGARAPTRPADLPIYGQEFLSRG